MGDETPKFKQDLGLDLMIKGYRSGGKKTDMDRQRNFHLTLPKEEQQRLKEEEARER